MEIVFYIAEKFIIDPIRVEHYFTTIRIIEKCTYFN